MQGKLRSTDRIFFCDISEFEWLVSAMGRSPQAADAALSEKIRLQTQAGAGAELWQVLPRFVDYGNTFNLMEIDHWATYIRGLRTSQG